MDQYQERNYAPKIRKIEKSDFRKHCDGGSGRKACEASRRDCILQGKKNYKKEIELSIQGQHEEKREREDHQTSQERRQRIQRADQRGSEAQEGVKSFKEEVNHGQSEVGIGEPIQSSGEVSSEVRSRKSSSCRSSSRKKGSRSKKNG